MNSFGSNFRVTIIGESHGPGVGVVVDGCPAGLELVPADFVEDLQRRAPGAFGTTPRKEIDVPQILSGVHQGRTCASPLLVWFENSDTDSSSYESISRTPRPSHADFTARAKYGGYADARGGGMFSGRLTAGLVAAGVVAKKLLKGVDIQANLIQVGGSVDVEGEIRDAVGQGDSVGGLVQCELKGVPVGLGEPWFDSAESLMSHAIFSIPGVKGVEFGSGFECAKMRGSECNDSIVDLDGKTSTNHSGGINGGITNGNDVVLRVAFRPTPSIAKAQKTIDLRTGAPAEIRIDGRHDACIARRATVVVEAACAVVMADLMLSHQLLDRVLGQG